MAITYGFFDAVYDSSTGMYDRTYTAEDFSMYLKGLISDGVVANVDGQLRVSVSSGMAVQVGTGRMFIDSRWMDNDAVITLPIGAAHATLNRRDLIAVRLDYSDRTIGVVVTAGTPAVNPTAPAVTRNDSCYEMALAEVYVKAGATAITAADITDKRADQTVCGYVVGLVDQIDTAGMWSQLEAGFGTWFDEMKDQLSEDAAGNLQLQINDLQDASEAAADTLTDLTGSQATSVSNADFNTFTTPGAYQIGVLSSMTNGPVPYTSGGYGSLEVIKARTYIIQRFDLINQNAGITTYVRSRNDGGTWSSWGTVVGSEAMYTATVFTSYATTYISSYRLSAYKIGRMVFLEGYLQLTATAAPPEVDIATLPAPLRPIKEWTMLGEITSGTSANQARNFLIRTDGKIRTHNHGLPTNTWVRFSAAYVSAS